MTTASGKPHMQPTDPDEVVALGALMEQGDQLDFDYSVVDEKPKRKRKPKPQLEMRTRLKLVVVFIALTLIVIGGLTVAFFMPVEVSSDALVVPQPIEQVIPDVPNIAPLQPLQPLAPPANYSLVDRWMRLNTQVDDIAANTFVRVMSQDNSPEFYNVADMEGHLTIVKASNLVEDPNPPLERFSPPPGPYSDALGKNEKLLVTVEWNGDMAPGTLVYAMGWRAEDGTWIYEVSPDRVKIYYLPWQHLKWAEDIVPPPT